MQAREAGVRGAGPLWGGLPHFGIGRNSRGVTTAHSRRRNITRKNRLESADPRDHPPHVLGGFDEGARVGFGLDAAGGVGHVRRRRVESHISQASSG